MLQTMLGTSIASQVVETFFSKNAWHLVFDAYENGYNFILLILHKHSGINRKSLQYKPQKKSDWHRAEDDLPQLHKIIELEISLG